MKIYFVPRAKLGKWSVGLIAVFFLLFAVFWLFFASGQRGGDTFFSNFFLAIPMLLAGMSGIFAFFTGIISIIKKKERSILVFLSTLIGFFILFWCFSEVIFPH
jgi:hypothetical protein